MGFERNFLILLTVYKTQLTFSISNVKYMMNNQKKSLLTILLMGASLTAPVLAQDIQAGLKDVEGERLAE